MHRLVHRCYYAKHQVALFQHAEQVVHGVTRPNVVQTQSMHYGRIIRKRERVYYANRESAAVPYRLFSLSRGPPPFFTVVKQPTVLFVYTNSQTVPRLQYNTTLATFLFSKT